MKILFLSGILMLLSFVSTSVGGQNVKDNQLVIIAGEKIIVHQVRAGETIYSISRDFKIEPAQLMQKNPGTENGLSVGQMLKVPFNEMVDPSSLPVFSKGEPTGFTQYTIQSNNETAYSISKKHGITVDELYTYNPGLQKLKKGIVLKVPNWEEISHKNNLTQTFENVTVEKTEKSRTFEHRVVSGETLFSICKKYNVTTEEVIAINPEAKNLKSGSVILIPQKSVTENVLPEKEEKSYILHTIESGETIYGLTRKYGITEHELKELNPVLKEGAKAGTVIKIPTKKDSEKVEIVRPLSASVTEEKLSAGCNPGKNGNLKFNIAVFLPLFLDANEELNQNLKIPVLTEDDEAQLAKSDTIVENAEPPSLLHKFYGNSENFLQFYEGLLIAADSMQKAGMKFTLNVYDTKESPETVRKVVNSASFAENDLIIGPVYENIQKEVITVSSKQNIPMISPFNPKSILVNNNLQFVQINPSREFITESTGRFVVQNYSESNIIIIKTSSYEKTPDGQLVDLIEKEFVKKGKGKIKVYDFRAERARGFANVFLKDKENVVIIPTSDEGELSVAISNLNNVADKYPITLIAGSNYQQKYPSIEVAHFHNLKMQYINPYWVDYQKKETIQFVERFKSEFGTEPNSYGFQGFDATIYFLQALFYYGKDFSLCLPNLKTELMQGNYIFEKVSPVGGFMNKGVSIISYNRDFEIEREVFKW